ncbi:MAG TPA: hypothetical protein VKZ18_14095 [Polyangia bacterium]|nr:hypothetical protein [Polyangia bacterium]
MKRGAGLFAAALATVATRSAWALCPNCLGQSSRLGAALRLVGVFLLVPPAVFFTVAIVLRRLTAQGAASDPASGGGGGVQGG